MQRATVRFQINDSLRVVTDFPWRSWRSSLLRAEASIESGLTTCAVNLKSGVESDPESMGAFADVDQCGLARDAQLQICYMLTCCGRALAAFVRLVRGRRSDEVNKYFPK
jgi:hypothetical protein